MKAAKFHSCVVGHLIDCKLTVIERDCALLLRRDMALGFLLHISRRLSCSTGLWLSSFKFPTVLLALIFLLSIYAFSFFFFFTFFIIFPLQKKKKRFFKLIIINPRFKVFNSACTSVGYIKTSFSV